MTEVSARINYRRRSLGAAAPVGTTEPVKTKQCRNTPEPLNPMGWMSARPLVAPFDESNIAVDSPSLVDQTQTAPPSVHAAVSGPVVAVGGMGPVHVVVDSVALIEDLGFEQ